MALRVRKKVVSKKMNAKSCREICVPLVELVSGVLEHKGLEHMVQSRLTDCEATKAKKYKLVLHSGSFKEQVQTKYSAWYSKTQFRMCEETLRNPKRCSARCYLTQVQLGSLGFRFGFGV